MILFFLIGALALYDALVAWRAKRAAVTSSDKLKNGDQDWDTPCQNCEQVPTVHPTQLCGPCSFGEAETAGGNW